MYKRLFLIGATVLTLILAACAPFVSSGSQGEILVYLGGNSSSRALSDPPFIQLPVFSSFAIRVSGPGMEPVEFNVDSSQSSFTAMVPGGSDRVVELYAPVDWVATDAIVNAIPGPAPIPLPTLVKAYGATATVDVVPGQRVTAVLRLEVVETKILLPDVSTDPPNYYTIYFADSSSHTGPYPGSILQNLSTTDFEFDRLGRLILTRGAGVPVVSFSTNGLIENTIDFLTLSGTDLDFDNSRDRLFVFNDGSSLYSVDMDTDPPATAIEILLPQNHWFNTGGVAVDSDGYVYVAGGNEEAEGPYCIFKLDVSSLPNAAITAIKSLEDLGLGYYESSVFNILAIKDMTIIDGMLYVLLSNAGSDYRGKLVEIDLASFTFVREIGWASTAPVPNPSMQFYGPQRFIALKPRRLIFADEGYNAGDIDRVVEVNLDTWLVEGMLTVGTINFFNTYFC